MKATILVGDVLDRLRELPDESVQCVVTSPPYWGLRDYKTEPREWPSVEFRLLEWMPAVTVPAMCCSLGLEISPVDFIGHLVLVFRGIRDALKQDGVAFVNMGDSYAAGGNGGHNQGEYFHGHTKRGGDMAGVPKKPVVGMKPKDLCGIPWILAFALRADGWYLRQDIIWHKPNPMPESVTDRCTKAHEYLFLLSKSARYYFDQDAILEPVSVGTHARLSQDVEAQIGSLRATVGAKTNGPMKAVGRHLPGNKTHKGTEAYEAGDEHHRTKAGLVDYAVKMRKLAAAGSGIKSNDSFSSAVCSLVDKRNKRSVWTIPTQSYAEAHFATYPEALVEPCILSGSREGDTVLDPFGGSGTTGAVALRYHRDAILIELKPEYADLAQKRIGAEAPMFNEVEVVSAGASYARPSPAAAD